ncbi:diacylglycerol kinase family protein [Patescibacteria group bacterium]
MLNIKNIKRSFKYAIRGVVDVFKKEQNFRIEIFSALCVILMSIYFKITANQTIALILVIMFVLVLELINSAFERMVDVLLPRIHEYAKEIKDIMAAMVLIASIAAVIIGILIFWGYIIKN